MDKDLLASKAQRYRSIFYDSPIALREEDWSGVKQLMDALGAQGVGDLRAHLEAHPQVVAELVGRVRIHGVNNASFKLYHARDTQEFLMNFDKILSLSESRDAFMGLFLAAAQGHGNFEGEMVNRTIDGEKKVLKVWSSIVPGHEQTMARVIVGMVDITEQKVAQAALESQKNALEQKNIALRALLEQIEVEKNHVKDDVAANVEELLLPALNALKMKGASQKQVDVLKGNLRTLTSSFGREISDRRLKLTPREIEICNMIKEGVASKDIASIKNTSLQTIHKHRNNIRRKLNIANKKCNLTSYLQTI